MGDHCDNDVGQLDRAHDRRDCGCCDNDLGEGDPDDGDGVVINMIKIS